MRLLKLALVGLALIGFGGMSLAQNLAEAAAKEKERRAKVKAPAKSYNDDNVSSGGAAFSGAGQEATPEGTPATSPSPKPKDGEAAGPSDAEKAEAAWRKQLQQKRTEVDAHVAEVDSIQLQLNDNTTSVYGAGRQRAVQELETNKAKLVTLRQELADLEEQGRRKRYRP